MPVHKKDQSEISRIATPLLKKYFSLHNSHFPKLTSSNLRLEAHRNRYQKVQ